MKKTSSRSYTSKTQSENITHRNYLFLFRYCFVIFILSSADAIMSYFTPVYLENKTSSSLYMGLILSFSSVIGFISDFLISYIFKRKTYYFFMVWAAVLAISFPFILAFFPNFLIIFLVAMGIWGVYYEFIAFSSFNFISSFMSRSQNASSWGMLDIIKSLAYAVSPLIAIYLIQRGDKSLFYGVIIISTIAFLFSITILPKRKEVQHHVESINLLKQLKIWKVLLNKVWPLYIFLLTVSILDSSFWTIWTIFSEDLRKSNSYGGLFITIFMIPALFMGILTNKVSRPFGKKRAAFISGLLAGLSLTSFYFIQNIAILLFTTFITGIFLAIAFPEISATFEDYVDRLGVNGNDMIGLQSSAISLAYILGPILNGYISTYVGNKNTFSIMGGLLVIVSLFSLLNVPLKIKMPMKSLKEIENLKLNQ